MSLALPDRETVLEAHEEQIAMFGGLPGIRDEGLLSSALARPANLIAYGGDSIDVWQVAASLGYGLAKNHAFFEGNKRTSLAANYLVIAMPATGSPLPTTRCSRLGRLWPLAKSARKRWRTG